MTVRLTSSFRSSQILQNPLAPAPRAWLASRSIHKGNIAKSSDERSASAKLFADAAREEAEEAESPSPKRPSNITLLENQNENWTGEESMQDAVLRMLVDKYKPLRGGPIRTAEEKLKQVPPRIHSDAASISETERASRNWEEVANEPLLPAVEGHKPWHTTFKAPSHATASIKLGTFPLVSARTSTKSSATDERTRKTERELQKRKEQAGRLTRARESTLDYRLGIKSGHGENRPSVRANPVSMRGWQSMIEDKIEKARLAGQFDKVKGRGQPLVRQSDERNPFIAREEFLMNRIVQRNGASPPWVEVQLELESAINSFREMLRQSWTRRAVRMLTVSQPATYLPSLALADITSLRDDEWEERERSYHDTAITELNSLVRKYNGLAPYAVRRPYYERSAELAKVYEECGEDILRGISRRTNENISWQSTLPRSGVRSSAKVGSDTTIGDYGLPLKLRDVIRGWLTKLIGRPWR
ncbi:hypothetical protein SERLA73DRAFT_178144 [Serpula lacrymans var. lacrymans S7.3]|uniref:DnaJ homologue subfamily C member 28 conserved domain-containing protein n=2 Tax=Serpula lacrymans var. lacrymans TaxID=341189 RepID=F8PQU0_SERL3|nr:uncharacterized protein SERLADRAFT_462434 [Serpula lacrymans var. lacrymans S7.9]EGO02284.1 hypothetical protein SERLA73DRAFT_178144 [Serpula lacrymans var. lacrymans S7.3]EGO28026.1 hypothetical protein SERLADRAFT_462434 [Serpula lacrymans var. lacrymans S7.9]